MFFHEGFEKFLSCLYFDTECGCVCSVEIFEVVVQPVVVSFIFCTTDFYYATFSHDRPLITLVPQQKKHKMGSQSGVYRVFVSPPSPRLSLPLAWLSKNLKKNGKLRMDE